MITQEKLVYAARQLREADENKITCQPIRTIIGKTDIMAAYGVQSINSKIREAGGANPVGCKIGLTSAAVQKQLGVDQPDFGILFDEMLVPNCGTVSCADLMQPKAEAEIAVVLKNDLAGEDITDKAIIESIDYILTAIEIVGSRISNWDIKITDTIADNASASHFVLGANQIGPTEIDLENCKMRMFKNGLNVSEGRGADCLGSPLNATRWLAVMMTKMGNPLKKGDIILTGALGPMTDIAPGDNIEANVTGSGKVSVNFVK